MSPDGQWLAYESNESGDQVEIYVRSFPSVSGRREKVSVNGGRYPRWGPPGSNELYYIDRSGAMMAASIELSPTLELGNVTKLFQTLPPPASVGGRPYDVSDIDGRFIMPTRVAQAGQGTDISVLLNWFDELRERVPAP